MLLVRRTSLRWAVKTHYMVELKGVEINGSTFSCEGDQLACLIEAVAPAIGECVWFASDLSDQIDGSILIPEGERMPQLIGDTVTTTTWLKQVSQFVWAVFLAVPVETLPVAWIDDVWAETAPFRDIGSARLEIRCFDGSHIYAFAPEPGLIQLLVEHFRVEVQTPGTSSWSQSYWRAENGEAADTD